MNDGVGAQKQTPGFNYQWTDLIDKPTQQPTPKPNKSILNTNLKLLPSTEAFTKFLDCEANLDSTNRTSIHKDHGSLIWNNNLNLDV